MGLIFIVLAISSMFYDNILLTRQNLLQSAIREVTGADRWTDDNMVWII